MLKKIQIRPTKYHFIILLVVGLNSCTQYFRVHDRASHTTAVTDKTAASDLSNKIDGYIRPLHDSLDAKMGAVLVKSTKRYAKRTPESEIGNILTDIMLEAARAKTGKDIDIAVTNSGGIRTDLPAGNVTVGNIYEIMPFDNELVVITLSGATMKKFLAFLAARKDPQSGMRLTIKKGSDEIVEAIINGKPFDESKSYTVATSDFVATGGDRTDFLKERLAYDKLGLLLRDVFIDAFRDMGKKGRVLDLKTDGRTKIID